ncbi:hypothetical protein PGT21_028589 [Puccinia graminis f. sp. tritici]|uniref:Uncharacterized protein n=1 Tax=Puccinia graminis f. sp. tritici TaxID=56615 RepID=A0A5B0MQB4_PUCGR|nr:hypothetical protein PGT21_028589 [Puccinia graminis f. sp. tritici]
MINLQGAVPVLSFGWIGKIIQRFKKIRSNILKVLRERRDSKSCDASMTKILQTQHAAQVSPAGSSLRDDGNHGGRIWKQKVKTSKLPSRNVLVFRCMKLTGNVYFPAGGKLTRCDSNLTPDVQARLDKRNSQIQVENKFGTDDLRGWFLFLDSATPGTAWPALRCQMRPPQPETCDNCVATGGLELPESMPTLIVDTNRTGPLRSKCFSLVSKPDGPNPTRPSEVRLNVWDDEELQNSDGYCGSERKSWTEHAGIDHRKSVVAGSSKLFSRRAGHTNKNLSDCELHLSALVAHFTRQRFRHSARGSRPAKLYLEFQEPARSRSSNFFSSAVTNKLRLRPSKLVKNSIVDPD